MSEMEARGGGFVSRRGLAGLRSRAGGSQGLILSPDRRVPRPLQGRSAGPQAPGGDLERFQRNSRCPAAGRLPAGSSGGIVPPHVFRHYRLGFDFCPRPSRHFRKGVTRIRSP